MKSFTQVLPRQAARIMGTDWSGEDLLSRLSRLVLGALSRNAVSLTLTCCSVKSSVELTEAIQILRAAGYSVEVKQEPVSGFREVQVRWLP